jgi:hypothetical protein
MTRSPSLKKKIMEWIDDIPDSKLDGTFVCGRPAYTDMYMRLDCQSITSDGLYFNLQVQINKECPDTTMNYLNPDSVAFVLAPIQNQMTPAQLKAALKATVTGEKVTPPRNPPPPKPEKKAAPVGNKNKARKR